MKEPKGKTTTDIAELFGVTAQAVGLWVKKGLYYETERLAGRKKRRLFRIHDVNKFLGLTDKIKEQ